MSLSDLIEIKKLDNIAHNIKELDKEVETIVKNLVEKYNTKKQFIKLNNLQKMSDRFTTWDYKTAHGTKNLIDKLNLLIQITRIQDHEIMDLTPILNLSLFLQVNNLQKFSYSFY